MIQSLVTENGEMFLFFLKKKTSNCKIFFFEEVEITLKKGRNYWFAACYPFSINIFM